MSARGWRTFLLCAAYAWYLHGGHYVRGFQVPPVCPAAAGSRCSIKEFSEDKVTVLSNGDIFEIFARRNTMMNLLDIWCHDKPPDATALPSFPEEQVFSSFSLGCGGIPTHPYSDILQALNVSRSVKGLSLQGATGELTRHHLVGLETLTFIGFERCDLLIAPDTFHATPHLDYLKLFDAGQIFIEYVPNWVKQLELQFTNITSISRAELTRLTNLTALNIRNSDYNISIEAGGHLHQLQLEALNVWLDPRLPETLEEVRLVHWAEITPQPWEGCSALVSLDIDGAAVKALPSGWVARCSRLELLSLEGMRALVTLPGDVLRSAGSLRRMTLTGSPLQHLPAGLFSDTPNLDRISLVGNQLIQLPSLLFIKTKVTTLDLSENKLSGQVLKDTVSFTLKVLYVDDNAHPDHLCPESNNTHKISSFVHLRLNELILRKVGATHICQFWFSLLNKSGQLNLANNHITKLTYDDVIRAAANDIHIYMEGNEVTQLAFDRQDYHSLLKLRQHYCDPGGSFTLQYKIRLFSRLRCDCHMQWGARAMRDCPTLLGGYHDWKCESRVPVRLVPPEELMCAASHDECPVPQPCRCEGRDLMEQPARVLRVTCEHANLTAVPSLPASPAVLWQLRLAHNNIATVSDKLPPNLLELDLRDNNVSRLDVATVTSLKTNKSRVLLSGNPLVCDCTAASSIRALIMHQASFADFQNMTCLGGAAIFQPDECDENYPMNIILPGLLSVLLVAIAALAVGIAWRVELVAVLRGLGCLSRPAESPDDRPYDAFISFSHNDVELVHDIMEQLESGARPYRVCVHSRDWVPGGWIPHLISESVRSSRRTIAVVSEHFLNSAWARAEFREAHAEAMRSAEPRLVIVLLADPKTLTMDDDLRRYLTTNSYLRWGDPWFWPKLRAALPAPREPLPSSAAGPPARSAAAALLAQQQHAFEVTETSDL
ncbi:uncharacterized protein LOC142975546 [Anticarsia gemmatalis]|uniref:uncharacterized protein LOC142975546 n=1 Tax=Anticarsia gemmatalis TaxID=129554 RepID=UPI003F767138